MNIKIIGSGSYIPEVIQTNQNFSEYRFLNEDGSPIATPTETIVRKFKCITGIEERRYASENLLTSDLAYFAADAAIKDAKIDKESIDYIILAHNFGNVKQGAIQADTVPSLAARVKHKLQIANPNCVAYDVLFGCPGWIEGVLQANAFILSGMAKRCLVIGAETLSRVIDPHDRDSMIYSDGAGATIIEASQDETGLLGHSSASYTLEEAKFLYFGPSYNPEKDQDVRYIKMYGRKIYEFALTHVPLAMKNCLDKSGITISEVKKVLIHQANEKMDEAIIERFYKLYDQNPPEGIMPMSIHKLGNSSVATVPTLYDLLVKGKIENQELHKGDVLIFASVGAGMNINAFIYRY